MSPEHQGGIVLGPELDSRAGGCPVATRTSASERLPRSTSMCTLVSKKAIIDVAGADRSGSGPQQGVRPEPLLLFC